MSFWKLDFRLAKMSIREGHKTRHRCSLSKLMSALGHKRTFKNYERTCPLYTRKRTLGVDGRR